jgi:hypothetical protein
LPGGAPSTSIKPRTIATHILQTWSTPTVEISLMAGQAGRDVTAVTLTLDDGSRVKATTEHGWFAAWWPSMQPIRDAEVTTMTGSRTQPIPLPGRNAIRRVVRPAPA